jgi:hypothetical protein
MFKVNIDSTSSLYLSTLQYIYDKYNTQIDTIDYLEEVSNPVFDWHTRCYKSKESRKVLLPSENLYNLTFKNENIQVTIKNITKENGELLPMALKLAKQNLTGTLNLTNPGLISHNKILEMYREIVDPNFTWKNLGWNVNVNLEDGLYKLLN